MSGLDTVTGGISEGTGLQSQRPIGTINFDPTPIVSTAPSLNFSVAANAEYIPLFMGWPVGNASPELAYNASGNSQYIMLFEGWMVGGTTGYSLTYSLPYNSQYALFMTGII